MVTGEVQLIQGGPEGELWRDQVRGPWLGDSTVVRLAWMPASLARLLVTLERMGRDTGAQLMLAGRTAVGAGLLRIDAAPDAAVGVIEALRRTLDVGNVVVLRAPVPVKSRLDVWGTSGSAAPVMRAIKKALDPSGILNAGRGPF
jgi:FAD/FMN-containing dehydrogenase